MSYPHQKKSKKQKKLLKIKSLYLEKMIQTNIHVIL
jgi:hypothetical protein